MKMKIEEAKEIISYIYSWVFVMNGLKDRGSILKKDMSKYSLQDLLTANKLVINSNKRNERLYHYHKNKGHTTKGYTTNMVLADRYIAAIYTALSGFEHNTIIAMINDVGVACVKPNYGKSEE